MGATIIATTGTEPGQLATGPLHVDDLGASHASERNTQPRTEIEDVFIRSARCTTRPPCHLLAMGRVQAMIEQCLSNGKLADGDFDDRIIAALTALPENKARYCMHNPRWAARPKRILSTLRPVRPVHLSTLSRSQIYRSPLGCVDAVCVV